MSARTKARKRAVDAIFAADLRDAPAEDLLEATASQTADRQNQDEIFDYARAAVRGYLMNAIEIDDLIDAYSHHWSIDRMPALDRAILRVALWEILHNPEIPAPVAIDEAVNLAKEYSTDQSGTFINGLLSSIVGSRDAK